MKAIFFFTHLIMMICCFSIIYCSFIFDRSVSKKQAKIAQKKGFLLKKRLEIIRTYSVRNFFQFNLRG